MEIHLRPVRLSDYRETEHVMREAFWNLYTPGCSEHYLVHIMRECSSFVPELDIVAVHQEKIVGNIVYLKSVIKGDDGNGYPVLSLGPIAVLPEYQHRGIGGQMIEYTRKLAREMGFRAVLLCGDPAYYSRQGFVPAEAFGIRTADNMYAAALQACELYENALTGAQGRYYEDPVYEVNGALAAQFDKSFPPKKVITGTPSQKRFEEVSSMRRKAR